MKRSDGHDQVGNVIFLEKANQIAFCGRCGEMCRVAETKNLDAQMLRHAEKPEGRCVNCCMREWFYMMTDVNQAIPDFSPTELLQPWFQAQMAKIIRASKADANPDEIDWAKLVESWDLPIPGAKKRRARRSKVASS